LISFDPASAVGRYYGELVGAHALEGSLKMHEAALLQSLLAMGVVE
jgi:hypothetical protein